MHRRYRRLSLRSPTIVSRVSMTAGPLRASALLGLMLAAGLALLAFAPDGPAKPTDTPAQYRSRILKGVNVVHGSSPAAVDRDLAAAQQLHARVVRVSVAWSGLEPSGPATLDPATLARLDQLVSTAAAEGIEVMMVVDSTPCWSSTAPARVAESCRPGHESQANAWPPRNPADYGAFVAYLAKRYGYDLAAIEVWNEPDQRNEAHLAGPGKAAHYAAILRAAYPAIKGVDPGLPVLGGAFVGNNGVFLRALYAAGIKGYYDGLAVHFYTLTLASLRAIHEVQLANGDPAPLWLDEFGWSSCWPHRRVQQEQACVTTGVQAANLADLTRSLTRAPYVAGEVVYELRGSAAEEFGVLSASGGHKPAFATLARAFAHPLGRPSPVALHTRVRAGRVIASGAGPVGDYMELEVRRGGRLRYRARFILDRFNRYSIALPPALGTQGLLLSVYQDWQGPSSAARRRT